MLSLALRPNIIAGSVWQTKAAPITVANSDREKRPRSQYFPQMPVPNDLPSSCWVPSLSSITDCLQAFETQGTVKIPTITVVRDPPGLLRHKFEPIESFY